MNSNKISNVKINYMILEQIIRVIGVYKHVINEYAFMEDIFKQAKSGKINFVFEDENLLNNVFKNINNITGVPSKYWLGEERIKLGIRCKDKYLKYDDYMIDTINLENDGMYLSEVGEGNAYHGKLYQEILNNPLHLEYEDGIYTKIHDLNSCEKDIEKEITIIESLYSLRGLLTVLLLNMADLGEIEIIDTKNVRKHGDWKPYVKTLNKPTQHGITYSPKFVEIRKGIVQTIIKNISDMYIDAI